MAKGDGDTGTGQAGTRDAEAERVSGIVSLESRMTRKCHVQFGRGRPTGKCFGQPEQLAAGPPYHHNCRVAGLGRLTGPATIQRWYCLRSSQTHLGKLDPTTRAGVAHPSVGAILPIGVSLSSAYRPTAHEWLSFWCRLENRYPAPFPEPAGRRMS